MFSMLINLLLLLLLLLLTEVKQGFIALSLFIVTLTSPNKHFHYDIGVS